jgi:ATP synthase protein I
MDDFSVHLKSVFRITIFFLSICFFGWALLSGYRPYFAGLILGTFASMVNASYMAWKIHRFSQSIVEKRFRRMNMGFITRVSVALLVAIVSIKLAPQVNFPAAIIGLFIVQLATLAVGIVSTLNNKKS